MKWGLKELKKYFIPHEGNGHRPYLLRVRTVVFVIMMAFVVESAFLFNASYVVPQSKLFGVILVNALVDGTNTARTGNDLAALRVNPLLQAAAQEKADDMVKNNYFAHTSPAGVSPWYWIVNVGYNFTAAGENLAVDFSDSADVTNAWMNSPGHRANIMNGEFTEVGMATAQGTFEGRPAVYVVELFGSPASAISFVPKASAAGAPIAAAPKPIAKPITKPPAVTPMATATGSETFATVKGAEIQSAAVTATTTGTAATSPVAVSILPTMVMRNNPIQAAVADPRAAVTLFYFVIAGVFIAALLLNIFIKIRIQYPALIFGGIAVVAIAGLFVFLNYQMVLLHAAVI